MKNMSIALLISPKKRIFTTVAKAKALRQYVEPLITRAKDNTTHSRRTAFSYLQNKEAVKELFGEIATKVGDRPGGYTRILKIGNRQGDNAEMALIELVDFNTFITEKPKKKSSRRRKKTVGGAAKPAAEAPKVELAKEPTVEAPAADEVAEDTTPEGE
jgi:large subunit ribosomal protein L17